MVVLSLLPLPARTKILLLPKSISLTRSDNNSALRSPVPYMSSTISRGVPERKDNVAAISC